jgi:hypothetical protein
MRAIVIHAHRFPEGKRGSELLCRGALLPEQFLEVHGGDHMAENDTDNTAACLSEKMQAMGVRRTQPSGSAFAGVVWSAYHGGREHATALGGVTPAG